MKTAIAVYRIYWPQESHRYILEHVLYKECPNVGDMFSHMMNSHNFRKREERLDDGSVVELFRPVDIQYLKSWVEKTRHVAEEYREPLLDIISLMNRDINVWMRFI